MRTIATKLTNTALSRIRRREDIEAAIERPSSATEPAAVYTRRIGLHGPRAGEAEQFARRTSCTYIRAVYFTFIPGVAPASGDSRKISFPPGPAASTMPSDTPKRILRGLRFASTTVRRPVS